MGRRINRFFILFFLCFVSLQIALAQNKVYVLLDSPSEQDSFQLHHYRVHTLDLYKVDYDVELYNVVFPRNERSYERIILFSALPDFHSKSLWREIKDTSILVDVRKVKELEHLFMPSLGYHDGMDLKRKFLNEYILVKKSGGKYLQAKVCLMEMFEVKNMTPIIPSPYGLLNLQEQPVSLATYLKNYIESNPNSISYPVHVFGKQYGVNYKEGWRMWKEYLSKVFVTHTGQSAYQFWTSAATNIADFPDISRGIERFVYVPGKGIVGGSYDFHFFKHDSRVLDHNPDLLPTNSLTKEEWNENVLKERVMIADGM